MAVGPDPQVRDAQPGRARPAGVDPLQRLWDQARVEERRIDLLLAYRYRPRFVRYRQDRTVIEAGVKWTRDLADPEFRKNLRIVRRLNSGAVGIAERDAGMKPAEYESGIVLDVSECGGEGHAQRMQYKLDQLISRLKLPEDLPITLKTLLGHRFKLEQYLVDIADDTYLSDRAAELYDEDAASATTWHDLYRNAPPLLEDMVRLYDKKPPVADAADSLPAADPTNADTASQRGAFSRPEAESSRRTRQLVARLLAVKEAEDWPTRARRELKAQVLVIVVTMLIALTALFGFAIGAATDDWDFLLASVAGATGAALGRLILLRDEVRLGSQTREFRSFFLAQVVVGAVVGMLVFLVDRANIIQVTGGEAGTAALAFGTAYSEAALLGLVDKIDSVTGTRPQGRTSRESPPRDPS